MAGHISQCTTAPWLNRLIDSHVNVKSKKFDGPLSTPLYRALQVRGEHNADSHSPDMVLESLVKGAGPEIDWRPSQPETFNTAKHCLYCLQTDLMCAMQNGHHTGKYSIIVEQARAGLGHGERT